MQALEIYFQKKATSEINRNLGGYLLNHTLRYNLGINTKNTQDQDITYLEREIKAVSE